jgi:hypothetical protein
MSYKDFAGLVKPKVGEFGIAPGRAHGAPA